MLRIGYRRRVQRSSQNTPSILLLRGTKQVLHLNIQDSQIPGSTEFCVNAASHVRDNTITQPETPANKPETKTAMSQKAKRGLFKEPANVDQPHPR
jgi:hypothetical protein